MEKSNFLSSHLINKNFVDQLDQTTKDNFIGTIKTEELYEIYWTISVFFDQNDCRIDISEFDKHFIPAVNLWKAFNHLDYGIQYYEFIKLTVKGTLQYNRFKGCEQIATDYIKDKVNAVGLEVKWDDMIK